jgi:hypothetical protein
MKQLLIGALLMVASTVTFAATEIWMMHNPACQFCTAFLDDHNIEHGPNHMPEAEFLMHEPETVILRIHNLAGTRENTAPQIRKAINARKLPRFRGTPHFYRWDTETESVTGQWTGWHSSYADAFRTWVLTGDDPRR